jgi:hypothetical protein
MTMHKRKIKQTEEKKIHHPLNSIIDAINDNKF